MFCVLCIFPATQHNILENDDNVNIYHSIKRSECKALAVEIVIVFLSQVPGSPGLIILLITPGNQDPALVITGS